MSERNVIGYDAFWLIGIAAFAILPIVLIPQRPPNGATGAPVH